MMPNLLILLLFISWRTINSWVLYLAGKVIYYLGFFPYPRELFDFGRSQIITALANFDGIHYLLIARRGNYQQWEQAYFPLYPLLIRVVNVVFQNELISALVISNISFLIGLFVLMKYLKLISNNNKYPSISVLLFLLAFPTSFFFGAAYTEGLFFLLFILTLYFLKKDQYLPTGFLALLAAMTRLIGVFLVIPITLHLIQKVRFVTKNFRLNLKYILFSLFNPKYFSLVLSPVFGLGLYCLYLWKTTGDPLMFLTSQPLFGANRSTDIILPPQVVWRYLKIFFTASHNFQYYVSAFEFISFSFVVAILVFDLAKQLRFNKGPKNNLKLTVINNDRLALNLFSFANIVLPVLTGTLSSIPRYALFSLSFFIHISEIKSSSIKSVIFGIFLLFHVIILALFGQGYFIS